MNIPVKNTRIASLDGWRAVAILLVLGSHFPYSVGFPERLGWTGWIFDGDLGVRIFFVLSGFLISHLLHREAEKNGFIGLKDFFIRRVFRIFPIYFAYLLVLALLQSLGMYSDAASSWLGCLTFSRNIVGRGDSATVHFWSLAVEEQFYMLWPLAFSGLALWRRRGLAALLLVIPLLACPLARAWAHPAEMEGSFVARLFGPRSIVMYADSLAVGCLGALGVAGWRGGGVVQEWLAAISRALVPGLSGGDRLRAVVGALLPRTAVCHGCHPQRSGMGDPRVPAAEHQREMSGLFSPE